MQTLIIFKNILTFANKKCERTHLKNLTYECWHILWMATKRGLQRAFHKRHLQSMRGGFVKGGQGFLQMQTSALFGAKKFKFSQNLWCVSHGREAVGLVSANILQTRGSIFAILCKCRYGWPLTIDWQSKSLLNLNCTITWQEWKI